jgi:DNA polymerase-1
MKIFDTSNLDEKAMPLLSAQEAAWIYNGLDVCVTAEVYNTLMAQLDTEPPNVRATYETALAKMAPIMEMSLRGTLIDEEARQFSIRDLEADLKSLDIKFQRIMVEVFGGVLNWRSPLQLKNLFYGMLGLKEIKKRNAQGVFASTVNREALEYFDIYLYAKPLARLILAMRDIHKQVGFLKTEIDRDQRIRTTYNIAGTNTGRLASSMSEFGTGTNLQNVNRKLRYPFTADEGMLMVNVDLEQADGRNVGAICHNIFYEADAKAICRLLELPSWNGPEGPEFASAFLNACESGDLHTSVCKMTWPELDWPDDPKSWKKFCDGLIAHGQDSYRQLAKKLGHGTNYYGTPRTMAKHAHVPTKLIEDFQHRYFTQFPAIKAWHSYTITEIQTHGTLTTPFGRRRMFFGRGNDASTWRKSIAYCPQSMTGEQIDRGLLQIWRKYPQVQLLNQVHDSILFQVPFRQAEYLIPQVLKTMEVTIELKGGRPFTVPLEAATGWNWGYADKEGNNKYGLKKWTGKEERFPPSPKRRLRDLLQAAPTS